MLHAAVVPGLPAEAEFWFSDVDGSVAVKHVEHEDTPEGMAVLEVRFELGGKPDFLAWLRQKLMDELGVAGTFDIWNYDGDGVEWSLEGTGELLVELDGAALESLHLRGELSIDYGLEWSYLWEAPDVVEILGERKESWSGSVQADWGRESMPGDACD